MGRIRTLPLLIAAAAGALLVSGASGADPRTPDALPGLAAPFLGTAVIGDGDLLGAVDSYGNLVDLRAPGPAGAAQIVNPFARQAAGSVPSRTGIVVEASAGRHRPLPLWQAGRVRQRYLAQSNVLRTVARVGGASVEIEDVAAGGRIARRVSVRGRPRQRVTLRLIVNLDPSTGFRCRTAPHPSRGATGGLAGRPQRLRWGGRGRLIAELDCAFAGGLQPAAVLSRAARAADRRWLARSSELGPSAPAWARSMYRRSLLVLRALTDRRSGAVAAAARDRWAYVWPRDAGTVAIALAAAGHPAEARRIARFLSGLNLGAGARFRGDGTAVQDGRALPGDSAGWLAAAARAAGIRAAAPAPGAWRDRGDYGERDGDRGDYLANAIAGGALSFEIRRMFGDSGGLKRRAYDPDSGVDSAAAWAVRPFPHPPLFNLVRRSLLRSAATAGRFGVRPSQDWPYRQAWTAPAAWSAWSLAALGERAAALRLIGVLRRAATPTGSIPERVTVAGGVPRSATPLGWSHAFAVLALRQLYAR